MTRRFLFFLSGILATACSQELTPRYFVYSVDGYDDATCDGPCPTVIIDSCGITALATHVALIQMPQDEPAPHTPYVECSTHSSGYVLSTVHVVDPLTAATPFKEADEFPVVFLGHQFSDLNWEAGDFFVLGLREDSGEWFATSAIRATPTNDMLTTDADHVGQPVDIRLPRELSRLKADFASVRTAQNPCTTERMSDASYHEFVRVDPGCGAQPADIADEHADDPHSVTD